MKKTPLTSPVETLAIGLASSAKGDPLDPSWGAMKLSARLHVAK